ncbi:uncharacterized protein T551_01773 [Pneumocystis jirovecii RU7]|uniref:Mediator of RNA polymerase II transcription subunit 8 n=1 Tax=Pneumocystis jirovecii (strain RU7) TaxID=1408657 RepID=A0A0W4ZQ37_PNEJ7|nr:uncharacterized protein T551_01773 [Pneumocystis jirovecii RU7]KTW30490.1 hypothetical protein T551_01773 [Pneumocystis jirovecii RU7]
MESFPLNQLESLRNRALQLLHSLTHFLNIIDHSDPLPSWPVLISNLNILLSSVNSISLLLQESNILKETRVFPSSSFPVRQQEGLLTTLLRKKVIPEVEEWETEGRLLGVNVEEDTSFYEWVKYVVIQEREKRNWEGYYTREQELVAIQNEHKGLNQEDILQEIRKNRKLEQTDEKARMNAILSFMRTGKRETMFS